MQSPVPVSFKCSFVLILAACSLAAAANAQGNAAGAERREKSVASARDRWAALQLTPDQRKQIAALEGEEKAQLATLPAEDVEGRARVVRTVRGQIRALLSPEQQARFDEMSAAKPAEKK